MKVIYCLMLISVMSACASSSASNGKSEVMIGMSSYEVRGVMGDPEDRNANGDLSYWQYCSTGIISDDYFVIWFKNDVVIGTNNYKNTQGNGFCAQYFQAIPWGYAPDAPQEERREADAQWRAGQERMNQIGAAQRQAFTQGLQGLAAMTSGSAGSVADSDWDWDAFYGAGGVLLWRCRGLQSGQFADDSKCMYDLRDDDRWPAK